MILRTLTIALLLTTATAAQNPSWERERRDIAHRKIERLEGQVNGLTAGIQEQRVILEGRIVKLESKAGLTDSILYGAIGLVLAVVVGRLLRGILEKYKD